MLKLAPGVVLFEKRPRWEAVLKRALSVDRLQIRPCRSAADLTAVCRTMQGSVAVIDYEVGPALVLEWLQQSQLEGLTVSPAIILPLEAGPLEWPLRELGAQAVLRSPIRNQELVALCRSLLPVAPKGVA